MWWLATVLFGLLALAQLLGTKDGRLTAAVLAGNWSACSSYSWMVGSVTSWVALAAIDYLAALLLIMSLVGYRDRARVLVISLYGAMLVAHLAYSSKALLGWEVSGRTYFITLTVLAWSQAIVTAGGLGVEYLRMVRGRADPAGYASAVSLRSNATE